MRKINIRCDKGQMITLMGVILCIAVLSLGALSAEIANINYIVVTKQSSTFNNEFNFIKEAFGFSLNYNLTDVQNDPSGITYGTLLEGDINRIFEAFENTKNEFTIIENRHGRLFDAILNKYWYPHTKSGVYNVEIIFYLDDGYSSITEKVTYSIVCHPKI